VLHKNSKPKKPKSSHIFFSEHGICPVVGTGFL
jgi:hypothetical protein